MTWYRVCLACAVSVALMACTEAKQGVLQPQGPLAGLRYVNLAYGTDGANAVDFRIINFIGDAPNAGAATFRTGGAPYGASTTFLPPHWPVEANRDVHIRVFMNDTLPELVSQVLFDTTCTFAESVNYTFFLYQNEGSQTHRAFVTVDTLPGPAGVAFRAINMAGTSVGALNLDVVAQSAEAPLAGTASFANVAVGATTSYTNFAVSGTLKVTATAPGSRTPILFSNNAPAGEVGTAALNPIAGTAVAGTAITAVIAPPSGIRATQNVTRSTDSAMVETGWTTTIKNRTPPGVRPKISDTTLAPVGHTHRMAVGSVAMIYGATQPEYNGWKTVIQAADTSWTTCLPADPVADLRRSCKAFSLDTLAVNYTSTVRSRFRYRLSSSTAVTPATGTVTYRAYTTPWVLFMIDRKPVRTAP